MTALSNATRRDGHIPPTTRLASDVLPEAHSSDTGVSVSYAHGASPTRLPQPHPGKQWFVLRITYHRALKAQQMLNGQGIDTYLPMRYTLRTENGRQRRVTTPLLPDFLFAYAEPHTLHHVIKHQDTLFRDIPSTTAAAPAQPGDTTAHAPKTNAHTPKTNAHTPKADAHTPKTDAHTPKANKRRRIFTPPETKIITYYYNHFRKENDKNPPLTIRHADMMNFIRLTSLDNEHIRLVAPHQVHYRGGEKVRVIDGQFKGICGRVARVAGQQRVVVELEGVCLVTTAYIPTSFILQEGMER